MRTEIIVDVPDHIAMIMEDHPYDFSQHVWDGSANDYKIKGTHRWERYTEKPEPEIYPIELVADKNITCPVCGKGMDANNPHNHKRPKGFPKRQIGKKTDKGVKY